MAGNWLDTALTIGGGIGDILQGSQDIKLGKKMMQDSNPFGAYRHFYGDMLKKLMMDPSTILQDPIFKSSLDVGMKGVERAMAAQGFLGSGNEATALFDYGQSHALDYMMGQEQFLGFLAGAQAVPQATAAGAKAHSSGLGDIVKGIGTVASIFSDRRLKTNIVKIGKTPGGQPWYSFDFIWGEKGEGVMADESPEDAVTYDPFGFAHVDYSKIR